MIHNKTRHLKDMYDMKQKILTYGDSHKDMQITAGVDVLETLRLSYEASTPKDSFSEFMKNDGALTRFVMNLSMARPNWAADVVSTDAQEATEVEIQIWQTADRKTQHPLPNLDEPSTDS